MPEQPTNPRVVYPNDRVIAINRVSYGTTILGIHVWISDDPQFVPWTPGVYTTYDTADSSKEAHFIIVGFDMDWTNE